MNLWNTTTKKMRVVISKKINLNALERLYKASHLHSSQITCVQNDLQKITQNHKNVSSYTEIAL